MLSKDVFSVTPYDIVIDYDMTLEDMVAAGNYDWGNLSINSKNFRFEQKKGKIRVRTFLVCFGKDTKYGQVIRELNKLGLRPGNLPELLAFGATYPEKQLEFPIVQFGTIWEVKKRRGRRGLYLRRGKKERGVSAIWLEHGFLSYYRFLAVEKDVQV